MWALKWTREKREVKFVVNKEKNYTNLYDRLYSSFKMR